jgi:enoyl-[acyl-carrier protein] reductase II
MVTLGRGRSKRGMFEGDLEDGELEIGQVGVVVSMPVRTSVLPLSLDAVD